MGLDTTHGAFHGPYSAFMRWRKALAVAAGGDFVPGFDSDMAHYTYEESAFDTPAQEKGFRGIMGHSDCDGHIGPSMCGLVADALEHLLPNIPDDYAPVRDLSMKAATEKFIAGCRKAHRRGERLEFG